VRRCSACVPVDTSQASRRRRTGWGAIALECCSDAGKEMRPINRFGHETMHVQVGRRRHMLAGLERTTHDDRELGKVRELAEAPEHVVPSMPGILMSVMRRSMTSEVSARRASAARTAGTVSYPAFLRTLSKYSIVTGSSSTTRIRLWGLRDACLGAACSTGITYFPSPRYEAMDSGAGQHPSAGWLYSTYRTIPRET
jgi:hypothetical protein